MHLYVRSMVESVFRLTKEFEALGYLSISPWVRIELSSIPPEDFNPNINVEFRNQAAAHTDCLLLYKESVDFISFVDLDDLIFPRVAGTYADEFRDLFGMNRIDIFTEDDGMEPSSYEYLNDGVGYIQYAKFNVHVEGHKSSDAFSLTQMFSSMYFTHQEETGKIVTRPTLLNHTWIHWPLKMKPGYYRKEVPPRTNVITHLKVLKEELDPPNKTVVVPFFDPLYDYGGSSLISPSRIKSIQEDLDKILKYSYMRDIWKNLPSTPYYLNLITDCFNKNFYKFYYGGQPEKIKCPGPERCKIPRETGILCSNAKADYFSSSEGSSINVHYAKNLRFIQENGCIV